MFAASVAKFAQLDAIRIVAPILIGRVVALFAICAGEVNHLTHVFLRHYRLPQNKGELSALALLSPQSNTSVMTPAPTVKPPSRMANFEPFSSATGTISSTVMFTLSPGITISTPCGS
jgi:hypothetical protein